MCEIEDCEKATSESEFYIHTFSKCSMKLRKARKKVNRTRTKRN